MTQENKVLNGFGVLFALCLAKRTNINPEKVINLLNEAGKDE